MIGSWWDCHGDQCAYAKIAHCVGRFSTLNAVLLVTFKTDQCIFSPIALFCLSSTCFWKPHRFCLECSQSCVNLWFACIKAAGIHQSRTDSPKPYGFTKAVRIHQSRKGLPIISSCSDSPKPYGLAKDPKLLRFTKAAWTYQRSGQTFVPYCFCVFGHGGHGSL